MSDSSASVAASPSGQVIVDTTQITQDGGTVVQRQRVQIGDDNADNLAEVAVAEPLENQYGLVVRDIATNKILDSLEEQKVEKEEFYEMILEMLS